MQNDYRRCLWERRFIYQLRAKFFFIHEAKFFKTRGVYQSYRRTWGGFIIFLFYYLIFFFIRAFIWTNTWVFRAEISITNLAKGASGGRGGGWFHEKRCYEFDAALYYLISLFFFFFERGGRNREERKRGFTFSPYMTFPPKTHPFFTPYPPPLFLFSYLR